MKQLGSGATSEEIQSLQRLLEQHSRLIGDFVLSSGIPTKYYFDAKRVILSPEGVSLAGRVIYPVVRQLGVDAVGGLAMGAIPLALAVSLESLRHDSPIPTFFVRNEKKDHGTKDLISASYPLDEAHMDTDSEHSPLLRAGRRLLIVDDVITTGDSVKDAIDAVRPLGCDVAGVVALVTRPEGGGVEMATEKFPNYITIFECDEDGNLSVSSLFERLLALPAS